MLAEVFFGLHRLDEGLHVTFARTSDQECIRIVDVIVVVVGVIVIAVPKVAAKTNIEMVDLPVIESMLIPQRVGDMG